MSKGKLTLRTPITRSEHKILIVSSKHLYMYLSGYSCHPRVPSEKARFEEIQSTGRSSVTSGGEEGDEEGRDCEGDSHSYCPSLQNAGC